MLTVTDDPLPVLDYRNAVAAAFESGDHEMVRGLRKAWLDGEIERPGHDKGWTWYMRCIDVAPGGAAFFASGSVTENYRLARSIAEAARMHLEAAISFLERDRNELWIPMPVEPDPDFVPEAVDAGFSGRGRGRTILDWSDE